MFQTLFSTLYLCFHRKGLSCTKAILFLSRFKIKACNNVRLERCLVFRSLIDLSGTDNRLEFINTSDKRYLNQEPMLDNAEIIIIGKNNLLRIGSGTVLRNLRVVIRGEGNTITIGEKVTCNGATLVCMGGTQIEIGNGCLLSDEINIWSTDSHPIYDETNKLINPSASISIGKNVWIGKQVNILKGVTIGDGAVIGMRSTVTHDICAHSLNVGIPAHEIKKNVHWERKFIVK